MAVERLRIMIVHSNDLWKLHKPLTLRCCLLLLVPLRSCPLHLLFSSESMKTRSVSKQGVGLPRGAPNRLCLRRALSLNMLSFHYTLCLYFGSPSYRVIPIVFKHTDSCLNCTIRPFLSWFSGQPPVLFLLQAFSWNPSFWFWGNLK